MDIVTEVERKCRYCGETKPLNDFLSEKRHKNGKRNMCKACGRAFSVEKRKGDRAWLDKYQKNSRETERYRRVDLLRRYGLVQKDYDDLLVKQGGVCAICGHPPQAKYLVVDHSHSDGHVRGLLCRYCNLALGHFKDSQEILKKALDYLNDN